VNAWLIGSSAISPWWTVPAFPRCGPRSSVPGSAIDRTQARFNELAGVLDDETTELLQELAQQRDSEVAQAGKAL
jgi:hypothetical protein